MFNLYAMTDDFCYCRLEFSTVFYCGSTFNDIICKYSHL